MPAFLDDVSGFIGNGKCNEDGLTLDEFLEEYNPGKYRSPSVTADVMIIKAPYRITRVESGLSILMVKRRNHPCIGFWALPGGFCEIEEDLIDTARRELKEETGLTDIPIELINTWGEVNRDPRDRIITAAYLAIINDMPAPVAGDDACDADWFNIEIRQRGRAKIQKDGKDIINALYNLKLINRHGDEECTAMVSVKENAKGIIKERKIEVIDNNNIAFDHAKFIIDAMLYIDNSIDQ